MLALAFISYLLRYTRWRWLLGRAGHRIPWAAGSLSYLSGFAFTATPGKVGELVRVRYFAHAGVPAARTISAFVYERTFDLLSVVLLAALAIPALPLFVLLVAFVAALIGAVALTAARPGWLLRGAAWLRLRQWPRLAWAARTLARGLVGCRVWLRPADMLVSLGLGLAAWGVVALSFAWLLDGLGIALPWRDAAAIYPTAMLAGAASMLPAGIGTTEATIVALLALHSVPLGLGALAAVGVRVATLWFAVLCGFAAIAVLERNFMLSKA